MTEKAAPPLTAEDLRALAKTQIQRRRLTRINRDAYFRTLTGKERAEWNDQIMARTVDGVLQSWHGLHAWLAARALCDHAGRRLFPDGAEAELNEMDGATLAEIWEHAQEVSGLTGDYVAAQANDMEKNASAVSGTP